MTKHQTILLYFFLITTLSAIGQVQPKPIDTISIFKNKTGISYRKYEQNWYLRAGNQCYRPSKMNKQDSIVMNDTSAHFIKVFNRRNKIKLEGPKESDGLFHGYVKFYNNNGSIDKIALWGSGICIDTLGERICEDYGPIASKTTYYRRNGTIKKTIFYTIKIKSNSPFEYEFVKQTLRYSRDKQSR